MAIVSRRGSPQPRILPALLVLAALLALTGCGDDDFHWGDCDPPPEITSTPPVEATVDQLYTYSVTANYICLPFYCHSVEPVQLPAGATMENNQIRWTPAASDANSNVYFAVTTEPDSCGNRISQSWHVYVYPAPP